MRPPHSTPNAAPGTSAFCAHCTNAGMVLLDGDDNVGAPCPMCKKGLVIDSAGIGREPGFWRAMPDDTTWENGLTVAHTFRCRVTPGGSQWPCGRPTTQGADCGAHDKRPGRLPAGGLARRLSA